MIFANILHNEMHKKTGKKQNTGRSRYFAQGKAKQAACVPLPVSATSSTFLPGRFPILPIIYFT
jgi:hypothetical protein